MKVGQRFVHDYSWDDAASELEEGVHPEVVAARLGEPIGYILEVADRLGWPINYQGVTVDQILSAHALWCQA